MAHRIARHRWPTGSRLLCLLFVSGIGCSTIVDADFDDLTAAPGSASGGSAGTGAVGASSGGKGGSAGSAGTNEGGMESLAAGGTQTDTGGSGAVAGSGGSGAVAGSGGSLEAAGAGVGGEGGSAGENEAGAGAGGEGGTDMTGGVGGAGGATGGVSGGGAGGTGGGAYVSPVGVVINELKGQGTGADYIELYNNTEAALDLSRSYVSDSLDPGTNDNVVTFLPGTMIAAKSYVVVRLSQGSSTGQKVTCFGYPECYDGTWGIAAKGEQIYWYDANDVLLDSLDYPDEDGAAGVEDGQSFGRLPDGAVATGALKISPGAANSAP